MHKLKLSMCILVSQFFLFSCATGSGDKARFSKPILIEHSCMESHYPEASLSQNVSGKTTVKLYISAGGFILGSGIAHTSGDERLDAEAIKYFSSCLYRPASKNGKYIPFWFEAAIDWKINEAKSE